MIARAVLAVANLTMALGVAYATAVFDDFDAPVAWTGPIYQYGNRATGDTFIRDGILTVRHAPVAKWHSVSMQRRCHLPLRPNTWFHFRFRAKQMLLGADMYTTVSINDQTLIQFGINGEQHWVQGARCQAKRFDDELFCGSPLIVGEAGGRNTDMRVGLPKALQGRIRYTDWVVFSVKYDAQGDERRVRLFVDGEEIVYRDIDSAAPQGTIDNRLRQEAKRPEGPATISLTLANFTDGDLYGDRSVNNGASVRWESAFADMTPAIPDPDTPAKAIKRDSDFQWDWVMIVDEANVSRSAGQVKRLIGEGRLREDVAGKVGLVARMGVE